MLKNKITVIGRAGKDAMVLPIQLILSAEQLLLSNLGSGRALVYNFPQI